MGKNLGKRLSVGDLFESAGNKHHKEELRNRWYRKRGRIYRKGDKDYFIKGKRRYFCEVLGISETRTGLYCWNTSFLPGQYKGRRWWQFVYVVRILEN